MRALGLNRNCKLQAGHKAPCHTDLWGLCPNGVVGAPQQNEGGGTVFAVVATAREWAAPDDGTSGEALGRQNLRPCECLTACTTALHRANLRRRRARRDCDYIDPVRAQILILPKAELCSSVRRNQSIIARVVYRIETALHAGRWAVSLARALGIRPQVTTASYSLVGRNTGSGFPALRLAYASDFHAGPTTDPAVARLACAALRAAEPDVVLFGGDFVNFNPEEIDWLAPELGSIPAPLGRFAVLGNHDWIAGARYVAECLEKAGIQVLTNRSVQLPGPFDQIWICGIDDHWCGSPDAEAAFAGADGYRVALMHAPSGLLDIGEHRFELALCGHTHGGQIALPDGRPLAVPNGALSRRYSRGRYTLPNGATLIVSVGVGCVVLPIRIHATPEIVTCTVGSTPGGSSSEWKHSSGSTRASSENLG
jgi:uncharacterized protein